MTSLFRFMGFSSFHMNSKRRELKKDIEDVKIFILRGSEKNNVTRCASQIQELKEG